MYNSDQQMKQIVQALLLTPDEKSTLYSNELHHSQSFQKLHNQLRSQNNLQTQPQSFLTTATKSLGAALKKPCYTHEMSNQPMQNLVVDSNKQSPSYPLEIPATPETYTFMLPPMVEHPERHWYTGDTDVEESDSDESEREHPYDTDSEETDLGKTEREEPYDSDVKNSDSDNKDTYEDEDSDDRITIIPRNEPQIHIKLDHLRGIISETSTETDLINVNISTEINIFQTRYMSSSLFH